ncbi:MAG: hypothetical protein ACLRUZ_11760 [Faecalimonas sp.]
MNQKIIKNTLILTVITLDMQDCFSDLSYEITKEPIAAVREKSKAEAWHAVFQEAETLQMHSKHLMR